MDRDPGECRCGIRTAAGGEACGKESDRVIYGYTVREKTGFSPVIFSR